MSVSPFYFQYDMKFATRTRGDIDLALILRTGSVGNPRWSVAVGHSYYSNMYMTLLFGLFYWLDTFKLCNAHSGL